MRGRPARRRVVYVIEGALEHQIESEPPATVKAGKALFMPAEAIQVVKNIGSGNAAELATYVAKKGKPLVVSGQVRTEATASQVMPMVHEEGTGLSLSVEGHFPSLEGASGWLNSAPLTPAGLRGKVVAVDFCTYTCINWIRSLPYVRAWAETYEDQGLVVIGVHTPEFSFEKDVDNIRRALADMRVGYPIAIDSYYAVWNAFANHYWPALYLIDAEGRIRHHRFGEDDYDQSEVIIRRLLADAGADEIGDDFAPVDRLGPEVQADWDSLETVETYLGYRQAQNFASPGGLNSEVSRRYERPEILRPNQWALSGDWTIRWDAAALNEPSGRIAFRFHARDVHLVMGPHDREHPIGFRVTVDGEPPGQARGTDVDADGSGTLIAPRLYQLIRQPGPIVDRVFEIEFLTSGAEGFAFTFG